jgi:hypothetical protein
LLKLGAIAPAVLLAMLAGTQTQEHITLTPAFTNGTPATSRTQLATGQYITPTVETPQIATRLRYQNKKRSQSV